MSAHAQSKLMLTPALLVTSSPPLTRALSPLGGPFAVLHCRRHALGAPQTAGRHCRTPKPIAVFGRFCAPLAPGIPPTRCQRHALVAPLCAGSNSCMRATSLSAWTTTCYPSATCLLRRRGAPLNTTLQSSRVPFCLAITGSLGPSLRAASSFHFPWGGPRMVRHPAMRSGKAPRHILTGKWRHWRNIRRFSSPSTSACLLAPSAYCAPGSSP